MIAALKTTATILVAIPRLVRFFPTLRVLQESVVILPRVGPKLRGPCAGNFLTFEGLNPKNLQFKSLFNPILLLFYIGLQSTNVICQNIVMVKQRLALETYTKWMVYLAKLEKHFAIKDLAVPIRINVDCCGVRRAKSPTTSAMNRTRKEPDMEIGMLIFLHMEDLILLAQSSVTNFD